MIEHLFIASFWIWGVFAVFDSKHLLGPLGHKLQDWTSITFCRPLFLCPTCMSSVHGSLFGIIFYGLNFSVLSFIICLAGLNYIIHQLLPEYD